MMGQVVEATLDESHSDLSVGEPADEGTEQLLCFVDQTLREMDLRTRDKQVEQIILYIKAEL